MLTPRTPSDYRFDELDLREEPPHDAKQGDDDSGSLGPECGPLHSRFKTCTC